MTTLVAFQSIHCMTNDFPSYQNLVRWCSKHTQTDGAQAHKHTDTEHKQDVNIYLNIYIKT